MERLIVEIFLTLFALEFLVEFGLNEANLSYVRRNRRANSIPDFIRGKMSFEEYDRSVEYTFVKGRFQRWVELYSRVITLAVLFGGVLPFLDQASMTLAGRWFSAAQAEGILFCLSVVMVVSLLSLPADLYSTFVIESRFGFNKTTIGLYVTDKLKGLIVSIVIGVPFLFAVLWLMDAGGPYWWVWAFLFIFAFQLLMVIIYPTLVAPLFNKFEPLKDGELRERILALAERIGFKASGIYTMDGSRRSGHSNAYFTGIGKSKRIVLFDTLVDQVTVEQGLAVLAHEMGHYKMKHIRRMLTVQSLLLLAGLYLVSLLVDYPPLFYAFGLEPSDHGALVLFGLLSGPLTFYLGPLMNLLSRKHEYEADRFAARTLGNGAPMEEALIGLTVKNLSNLTPHPWYSAYHYSHPTVAERIDAIRQWSRSIAETG